MPSSLPSARARVFQEERGPSSRGWDPKCTRESEGIRTKVAECDVNSKQQEINWRNQRDVHWHPQRFSQSLQRDICQQIRLCPVPKKYRKTRTASIRTTLNQPDSSGCPTPPSSRSRAVEGNIHLRGRQTLRSASDSTSLDVIREWNPYDSGVKAGG